MREQMRNPYCLSEEEWNKARATFVFAKKIGFIADASVEALEVRRQRKNEERKGKKERGELFYGPDFFTKPMYLQYELTRFRLDFVQPCERIKKLGICPKFTEDQRKAFYEQNKDLFRRYHGDLFAYEDVEQIIEKRLREDAYERQIQDILCQSDDWK